MCDALGADLVIIGATSLLLSMGELGRFTRDVDVTVALDLDGFALLTDQLNSAGWKREPKLEHRWVALRQTIVDLLPAGPTLRRQGSILWPESQFTMSPAGFDHVFANAVDMELLAGTRVRVALPIVTTLLKSLHTSKIHTGAPRTFRISGSFSDVMKRRAIGCFRMRYSTPVYQTSKWRTRFC